MDEVKRYKCVVAYDGTNYAGWQSQNNSVQEAIETALSKITQQNIRIYGSGRTDAKVHAYGQVFHFDTNKTFKDLKTAINSQLPKDIHILSAEQSDMEFHARYSAKGKHYDYIINNGEYDPIRKDYEAFIAGRLDIEKMREAGKVFIGTHDFTSFNATKCEEIEDQIRTIERIDITQKDGRIILSYYGNGFLRYMVRMISQTIIEIGLGKIDTSSAIIMLREKSKTACPYNGQPQGLYLMEVYY